MKKIIFVLLLLLPLVSPAPQAIFSYINLTISGNNTAIEYHIWGEGLDAKDTIYGDSFSYEKLQIPYTFSRNFDNGTDAAIVLNILKNDFNFTTSYKECMNNLTKYVSDASNYGNYSICSNQLNSCNNDKSNINNQINDNKEELDKTKSHRTILLIISAILIATTLYYRGKVVPRTVKSPSLIQLPSSGRA